MAKACGERSPSRTYANADGVINPPRTAEHGRRRGPAEVGTRPRTGYPPGVFPVRPRDLRRPGHVANNAIPVLVPQYAGQAHASPPELVAPLPRPLTIPTVMDLVTLGDVRALIGHLPKETRAKDTWQYVEAEMKKAAAGGRGSRPGCSR